MVRVYPGVGFYVAHGIMRAAAAVAAAIAAAVVWLVLRRRVCRVRVGGRVYLVMRGTGQESARAHTLHRMYLDNRALARHLRAEAADDPRMARLARALEHDPPQLREVDPRAPHVAYSEGKGRVIAVCFRHALPYNEQYFVMLHELAHVANATWGHDDAFWACFATLLGHAVRAGLYERVDYARAPVTYCGEPIDDQPLTE
jgi:hypothetical protein